MKLWDYIRKKDPQGATHGLLSFLKYAEPEQVKFHTKLRRDEAVEYLGACSESYSGHTRQAALKALASIGQPRSIQYVIPRLADWVPQVRDEAQSTLDVLIEAGYVQELLDHYNLIENLARVRRVDLSLLIQSLHDIIRSPVTIDAVFAVLDHERVSKRQFAYSVLSKEQKYHEQLIGRALKDPAPTIRLWLVRSYLRGNLVLDESAQLKLVRDSSSMVSVTMLRSFSDEQIREMKEVLIKLASSPSPPIRQESIFYLTQKCNFDILAYARGRLASSPSSADIETIGERGDSSDFTGIFPYLKCNTPGFRRVAVAAIGMLSQDSENLEVFLNAIQDPNKKVRHAAFMALASRPRKLWYQDVFDLFLRELSSTGYRPGHLIATLSGWDVVPVALVLMQAGNPHDRFDNGISLLMEWQRSQIRGWIQPDRDVFDLIRNFWPTADRSRDVLSWQRLDWSEIQSTLDRLVTTKNQA